jgi:hypothetical protein
VEDDLRAAVRAIIDAADPVGLLAIGAPADEYEWEVNDLVALVRSGKKPTSRRVRAILRRWFGKRTRISRATVAQIADGLAGISQRP